MLNIIAQTISNCSGSNCLTNIPEVDASPSVVSNALTVVFGVIGAITVIIIIVQAIRFILSNGDSKKAADARKGVIYAAVGLGVVVSAEIIINFVVGKI